MTIYVLASCSLSFQTSRNSDWGFNPYVTLIFIACFYFAFTLYHILFIIRANNSRVSASIRDVTIKWIIVSVDKKNNNMNILRVSIGGISGWLSVRGSESSSEFDLKSGVIVIVGASGPAVNRYFLSMGCIYWGISLILFPYSYFHSMDPIPGSRYTHSHCCADLCMCLECYFSMGTSISFSGNIVEGPDSCCWSSCCSPSRCCFIEKAIVSYPDKSLISYFSTITTWGVSSPHLPLVAACRNSDRPGITNVSLLASSAASYSYMRMAMDFFWPRDASRDITNPIISK